MSAGGIFGLTVCGIVMLFVLWLFALILHRAAHRWDAWIWEQPSFDAPRFRRIFEEEK